MSIGLPLTLGGVGINEDLPAAVSYLNLTNQVVDGKAQVEITWGNPASNFGGVAIVRKEGSAPAHFTDGVRVYDGTGASCIDSDVEVGKTYFYRAFPYNGRRQVQTLGAVPFIVPALTIRPSEIPYKGVLKLTEATQGEQKYLKYGSVFLREKVQPTTYANTTWSNRTTKVQEILQKELPSLMGHITAYGCPTRMEIDIIWYMGSSYGRRKTPSNTSTYVPYFIEKDEDGNLVNATSGLLETASSSSKNAVSISISLDENVQIQAMTDWEGCYVLK